MHYMTGPITIYQYVTVKVEDVFDKIAKKTIMFRTDLCFSLQLAVSVHQLDEIHIYIYTIHYYLQQILLQTCFNVNCFM